MEFDDIVLEVFLRDQRKLFKESVADSPEEAESFLEDVCAVVVSNISELREYLDDVTDITSLSDEELIDQDEVFEIGDGRYLVVEA